MTLRPAAARAWCSALTCWRRRSMPRTPAKTDRALLMSPRGRPLTQSLVAELAAGPGPLIVCGRFEGIDRAGHCGPAPRGSLDRGLRAFRRRNRRDGADRRLRATAAGRNGKLASGEDESFSEGLLEYPQFTRPQEFEGRGIPEILISGDHAKVAAWRRAEAEALTRARRPDLWARSGPAKRHKKHDRRVTSAAGALYERQIRAMAG